MDNLKNWRTYVMILVDVVLVNVAYRTSYYFRFLNYIPYFDYMDYRNSMFAITAIYILCFCAFRLYSSVWEYASIDEFLLVVGGCVAGDAASVIYGEIVNMQLPFSINILAGIMTILLVCGFRMCFRIYERVLVFFEGSKKSSRVMIVGAGAAGILVVKEMNTNRKSKYKPVAFIDDDRSKIGKNIAGVRVFGNRHQIGIVAKNKDIDIILIAIPSIDNENRKQIIDLCKETGCKVQIMPGVLNVLDDNVSLNSMRDVGVEDLLGRDAIKLDMNGISDYIRGKTILVTGGGGSIGSELCRQIAKFRPQALAILDIYENNAYDIQNELQYKFPELNLKVYIASVRDKNRLDNIFGELKPDVVFHAAAHKHVPLMEENPAEAIKNNIFGTLNTAKCADEFGVKRFVMISTDKAVNPTNVMGATKRVCEMIIQAMDKNSETEFVAVRFGNVLGSNGSVVPLFKKEIAAGGPVTVTDRRITRFFMTIPEAAQLVLQAGAYARGGEIFVLDMGHPVKIYDLACDLIRLSGFEPGRDIKIKITGLRPGEKLYEEVLMDEEGLQKTGHNKIFVARPTFDDIDFLGRKIGEFKRAVDGDDADEIRRRLKELVPTYNIPSYEETEAAENN